MEDDTTLIPRGALLVVPRCSNALDHCNQPTPAKKYWPPATASVRTLAIGSSQQTTDRNQGAELRGQKRATPRTGDNSARQRRISREPADEDVHGVIAPSRSLPKGARLL